MTMSLKDCRGLEVSSSNQASLERFEQAVELTASYFVDPLALINTALEREPSFAMGHCLRAALGVMSSERGALPMVRESVAAVEARGSGANDRERAHAAAARSWMEGDLAGAVRRYGDIIVDFPRDLLALQVAHVGDFFLGQSAFLRDRVAQVLPAWDGSVPGYGYVLGMHAFGLEETGLYDRAEDTGRKALELNRRDPWAVHAVAHVMEMQGRIRDGIEFLGSRTADWSEGNGLAYHNWWHVTLHHLELGQYDRVLEIFDTRIRPAETSVAMEMLDASALLWRLTLRGIDVGARWKSLAASWQPLAADRFYAFNDAHAVMAFVGAGDWPRVDEAISSLELAAAESGTNGMMSREVGLPLARSLAAFGREDYATAIDLLTGIRPNAHRFGGSHAQRDLLQLTLLESAFRAGRPSLARALAAERTELRRMSPFNWWTTARALEALGRKEEARRAEATAVIKASAQRASPVEWRAQVAS
jgi:tetratricopeptide (TPR) repeat protein